MSIVLYSFVLVPALYAVVCVSQILEQSCIMRPLCGVDPCLQMLVGPIKKEVANIKYSSTAAPL